MTRRAVASGTVIGVEAQEEGGWVVTLFVTENEAARAFGANAGRDVAIEMPPPPVYIKGGADGVDEDT